MNPGAREPKGELARYAYGYSDQKPGKLWWAINIAMVAFVIYKFWSLQP